MAGCDAHLQRRRPDGAGEGSLPAAVGTQFGSLGRGTKKLMSDLRCAPTARYPRGHGAELAARAQAITADLRGVCVLAAARQWRALGPGLWCDDTTAGARDTYREAVEDRLASAERAPA
jgi:hypothetical protein